MQNKPGFLEKYFIPLVLIVALIGGPLFAYILIRLSKLSPPSASQQPEITTVIQVTDMTWGCSAVVCSPGMFGSCGTLPETIGGKESFIGEQGCPKPIDAYLIKKYYWTFTYSVIENGVAESHTSYTNDANWKFFEPGVEYVCTKSNLPYYKKCVKK